MNPSADILFSYLRDVIYNPSNASLNVEDLPHDFQDLGSGLKFFAECVMETQNLARALSQGYLVGQLPPHNNEMAAPLKSLHASLKHLTWQAQQIAQGDYNQRVAFMGEFSEAFNTMVEQLSERQQKLEDKIDQIEKQSTSLEQSNLLLSALMHYVPLQIIVLDKDSREVLLMNNIAAVEVVNNPKYIADISQLLQACKPDIGPPDGEFINIQYTHSGVGRHFVVKAYPIEWHNSNAVVWAIDDISDTKNQMEVLEVQAYHDSTTKLYNRAFAMRTLNEWMDDKKQFVLIFADLDRLKYINDVFGHSEGDIYIMNAARHLKAFSPDVVACRIGGDEFMLLVPNISYDEAHKKMTELCKRFQSDDYLSDKDYSYSMSFGISVAEAGTALTASEILSLADERMYEDKRTRKRGRSRASSAE